MVEPAELLNLLLWLWLRLRLLLLWRLVELHTALHHLRDLTIKRLILRHQSVYLRFLLVDDALIRIVIRLCLLLLWLRFCLLCLLLLLWLCWFCLLLLLRFYLLWLLVCHFKSLRVSL